MSLEAGHPFAHYEILEPIGKRGTREVYRVRDGKLGRDVALKLLPDEFAPGPGTAETIPTRGEAPRFAEPSRVSTAPFQYRDAEEKHKS
jgi:hypothetical protein